jgi:Fe-S oxidoreductase
VHDPCGLRDQGKIHNAVRRLIINSGLTIEEMPHSRNKTLCCGEGGGAGYINKELSDNWGKLRRSEAGNKRIIAYCAGCTGYLGQITPTSHLVDLLFEPEKTLLGQEKVAKSPVTYLNRIILKKKLKLLVPK